ncbi:hypothetical protein D9611_001884 [Ephemerocybe angulata]|uniref:Uncharacterized protein n=1 Tax=Ephemerocybe angulata TaxID=980116 RepID=A0A8H5CKG9_9AGAR|nr:hypothetical protein D9611_001884 [Tulosesus angulatus]
MPWPQYINNAFEATLPNSATDEGPLYGPYLGLLKELFPTNDHYLTRSQVKRPPESIDCTRVFIVHRLVHRNTHPVFFLEIRPPGDYIDCSSRAAVDDHVRGWLVDLAHEAGLPIIHGVSAFGTRLCFYSYTRDNQHMDPPHTAPAPAAQWNVELLSNDGAEEMTRVANDTKNMVAERGWLGGW